MSEYVELLLVVGVISESAVRRWHRRLFHQPFSSVWAIERSSAMTSWAAFRAFTSSA
jgi:hypothetical protein